MWTPQMTTTKTNRVVSYLGIFISVLSVDQGTKLFFSQSTSLNSGISLGFLAGVSWWSLLLFAGVGWVITWRYFRVPAWSHALFWGSAGSNIVDRVLFDGVRDIWMIPGTTIMNNCADWVITGVALYWMYNLAREERETSSSTEEKHA